MEITYIVKDSTKLYYVACINAFSYCLLCQAMISADSSVLGNSNFVPDNIHILRYSALQDWLLTIYEDYENLNAAKKNNYIHRSTRMSVERPDKRGT